jgi:DNA-binding NtrC family response regulator
MIYFAGRCIETSANIAEAGSYRERLQGKLAVEKASKLLVPESEVLLEVWAGGSEVEMSSPLWQQALRATSWLENREGNAPLEHVLRDLLALFGGERAYAFELSSRGAGEPEVIRCLGSRDIDGDEVQQAERKVPRALLLESASQQQPVFQPLGHAEEGARTASCVALPAVSRGRCVAVTVVENRFQDLKVHAESASLALVYCRCLAAFEDLERLLAENASLWQDLDRLRETDAPATDRQLPAASRRPPAAVSGRAHLKGDYSLIVGSSPKMTEVLEVIDRISNSNAPVLINGESGTGKELVSVAIHSSSLRRGQTFVSENCGAITETLLESELFGYAKGAFTGATKDHKGLFELAVGGTLFLDEVGDMSPSMQKKLLRVLQEGVIRPVGAKDFISVNVRIISATNKDLLEECRTGNFREDLYYRLNVINVKLPPLRDRREDIADLTAHFLRQATPEGQPLKEIEPAALEVLVQYDWPGNIRELQNEVKKLVALSDSDVIRCRDLSEHLHKNERRDYPLQALREGFAKLSLKEATEEIERELIRASLEEHGGNKSLVAKALKIPKTSLYNKISKYKL